MRDDKDLVDAAADLLAHMMGEELLQLEQSTEPLPHVTTTEIQTGGDRTIRPAGAQTDLSTGQLGVKIAVAL
jgi:hypothetical protein